jgi:retron-type reverse transcriptase
MTQRYYRLRRKSTTFLPRKPTIVRSNWKLSFAFQGALSPLLANLFLHYAFDMWMAREFPHIPFERYADDAICHCRSAEEAQALWSALGDRLAACKLVLHPVKTKVVYRKDASRSIRPSH